MATRFYLPLTGAAPVSFTPTLWDNIATGFTRYALVTSKLGDALTNVSYTVAGTSGHDYVLRQWISPPLTSIHTFDAVTGPTVDFSVRCFESNSLANSHISSIMRVISNDGLTSHTSAGSTDATEMATSLASRIGTPDSWGVSYTNVVGDRICIEFGFTKNSTTSYTINLNFGTSGATDLLNADDDTGADSPWVEFSHNFTFGPESTGANRLMMMGVGT